MDFVQLASMLLSAGLAAFSAYQATKRAAEERERASIERLARLETKVDLLSERVEKHNNVVERTFKLETEVDNIYHRLDDLKAS